MCEPGSDSTVKLTQLKDKQFVGTIASVDAAMEAFRLSRKINGCALGVVQGNEIVYLKGYGQADVAEQRPFTVGTPSLVGSIAKTVTALGVLVLCEKGLLELGHPINDFVPIDHSSLTGITIQDLLSHKSGINHNWPNFTNFPMDEDDLSILFNPVHFPTLKHPGFHPRLAYLTYFANSEFSSGAAASGHYSTTNFTLLGAIIDEMTNAVGYSGPKGYEAFVWENVCKPADMWSPCLAAKWRLGSIHNLATGYMTDNKKLVWPDYLWGWEGPGGGWTMTIGDLARLMLAINTDKVISATMRAEMMKIYGSNIVGELDGKPGLGVLRFSSGGISGYMHHGDIDGYTARYTFYDNLGIGVALLFNKHLVNKSHISQLTLQIRDLFVNGAADEVTFTDEDRQRQRSAVYRVATKHSDKVRHLARLLEYQAGDPKEVVSTGIKLLIRTEGERGKRLLRYYNAEEYERAAQIVLDIIESHQRNHISEPPGDTI